MTRQPPRAPCVTPCRSTLRGVALILLKTLAADDLYRLVVDGAFDPQHVSHEHVEALRSALLADLLAEIERRPCNPSRRSHRLERFVPFLARCLQQGYPMTPARVLDPDLIQNYIAQCPEAASTTDGVHVLRRALASPCAYFATTESAAQVVR